MLTLVIQQGPRETRGRRFSIGENPALIGREADADVSLPSKGVSRRHARIVLQAGVHVVEDLGSTNGIYLNNQRVATRASLNDHDELRIADFVLKVVPSAPEPEPVIRDKIDASTTNHSLYHLNPAVKLQAVLELSQHLSLTVEQQPLLDRLLEHLLKLFPLADQAMILRCDGDQNQVHGQRGRRGETDFPYSRTLVNQALADGVGILSADVRADQRFDGNQSLATSAARSLLCVPVIGHDGRRLAVLQMATIRDGRAFQQEDLHLFTTIALQVAVVLENAALNAQRLREAQLHKELAMARDIQQSVLPTNFGIAASFGCEIFAKVWPAHTVSGDLYDFFPTRDGRLAFFVGDVSGKGMPAALFMFSVRSLGRFLAAEGGSPAQTLTRLHQALVADNAAAMFVTLVHGVLNPANGEVILCSGGHPPPHRIRADGRLEVCTLSPGRILGCDTGTFRLTDTAFTLNPGETLIHYTDGFTEAFAPDGQAMFGPDRFKETLAQYAAEPLPTWADRTAQAILRFTSGSELQDDLTLLMLRRNLN